MNVKDFVHARLAGQNPAGKLAVVAEDSGQKWVISAGMASRLEAHGIKADIIGGSSGGGLAMLYHALGQTREGTLCLRPLSSLGLASNCNHRFISLKNLLHKKPIMNIDAVVHEVFTHTIPLAWARFVSLTHPYLFLTYTTKDGEAKTHQLNGATVEAAKAMALDTARFPVFAGSIEQNSHFDGGFTNPLPIQTAFDLGATYVLALRCVTHKQPLFDKLVWHYLRHKSTPLARLLRVRHAIRKATTLRFSGHPQVMMVELPTITMTSTTSNPKTMLHHAMMGWDAMGEALGLPPRPYPKIWQPLADELGLGKGQEFA